MSALDSSLLNNTNTALYTDIGENTGCSGKIGMEKVHKGGGYGVTMESLQRDAASGNGYLSPSRVQYSNCNSQKGGNKNLGLGHQSLAESRFNHESMASYGYDKAGAANAHLVKGGYAPISRNDAGQQCGGRRRKSRRKPHRKPRRKSSGIRKKSRRKPRRKSSGIRKKSRRKSSGIRKKSRRKSSGIRKKSRRKPRKKSRRSLKSKYRCKCKDRCKCKGKCKCKGECVCRKRYRRRRRKKQRGGSSIFYSGVSESLGGESARLLGGDFTGNNDNCGDNYNHFNKSKSDKPSMY